MNLLTEEFLCITSVLSICCIINLCYEVPLLQLLLSYGKTSTGELTLSVPRQWFYHIYAFATCFHSWLVYVIIYVYYFGKRPPEPLLALLDFFAGQQRTPMVECTGVAVAVILMLCQVLRRLYECSLLFVYSGRLGPIYYSFGFLFYFNVCLSLLSEAQGFDNSIQKEFHFSLSFHHILGILLFFIAFVIQFKSHKTFANLRKDTKGRVVTYSHSIPRGHFFELISCPHYFAEILIYLAINIIMGGKSITWWSVMIFVLVNQTFVSIFHHKWYLDRFHDYPKQRKAVFPFII